MKLATSAALVLGAASSLAAANQQVLGGADDAFPRVVHHAADDVESWWHATFADLSADVRALWDEVTLLVPDGVAAFKKSAFASRPKKPQRKPDSKWDYVVKGADVQNDWVEAKGGKHRKVGGRLESYNLRAKKVDPSKLGVDKVKQYSGYLDDEANDKHLFYCKSMRYPPVTRP